MGSNEVSLRDDESKHMKSNQSLLEEIWLGYSDVRYEHKPSLLNVAVTKVYKPKNIKIKNTNQSHKIFQFL